MPLQILTRRKMIGQLSTAAIGTLFFHHFNLEKEKRFLIGACDWSINQRGKVEALETAKAIGLDGVQLSLGTISDDMHLREKNLQHAYLDAAKRNGVRIGGLAIGELNKIPYKSDPRTEAWVMDSIDVAKNLGVKNILLAFFENGDLRKDIAGQNEVIKRLQNAAPLAEQAGITLGIESWLSAAEHMRIIEAVGSPNVKVYYDVCNSNDMGYNIYDEIRSLGKNICEFHCKENGYLLGEGKIDFKEVRKAIDDINYTGWLQIEGAISPNATMLNSYTHNLAYLRSIFPD